MKKLLYFLFTALIISILLTGCNHDLDNTIYMHKKPNNFYYTNILSQSIDSEPSYKCSILNVNFYKRKDLDNKNTAVITSMIKSLNKNNFVSKPENLNSKPPYKIFFTFNNKKMVMNVYDQQYVSVYPWDGNYSMDYIDMKGLPIALNIYNLCDYIFNSDSTN
ncbi:DUF4883 family protein [Clostridium sp. JN-1]|uniref:DUF4883 family protein n=1 Tax=Clostridium sp. JN-1 TaxID=2483110 RepID=UPI000F0B45D9|nr:DUF4883 family protein [Clostridium sp. JN-1]